MIDSNDPAFAFPASHYPNGQTDYGSPGMTIRTWLTGQALNGLLSGLTVNNIGVLHVDELARGAVKIADAIIEELNKNG